MKKSFIYSAVLAAFLSGCGNDNISIAGGDLFGLLGDKTEKAVETSAEVVSEVVEKTAEVAEATKDEAKEVVESTKEAVTEATQSATEKVVESVKETAGEVEDYVGKNLSVDVK